jgi:PPK2 family polyphosphate:nucleotide phosphotransferase
MRLPQTVIDELRVAPGKPARLSRRSTSSTATDWVRSGGKSSRKERALDDLAQLTAGLTAAQDLLYASGTWALLVILQGLDAAGKDGTIKHVMSGMNPQGCRVASFKEPTAIELAHDFLWRCARQLPARGEIGVFNRSYYEDVLVVQVRPELLAAGHLPPGARATEALWRQRYEDISTFEQHLQRNGTRVVKFFLHVSKDEQKRRFLARLDDPSKHWKFSQSDLEDRSRFDRYRSVYEKVLTATSTPWAPWYVIPADRKYQMRALVAGVMSHEMGRLGLHYPEVGPDRRAAIEAARAALLAE